MLRVVAVSILLALLSVISIWWPVLQHQYYARSSAQGDWTQASDLKKELWAELATVQLGIEVPAWEQNVIATADQILSGYISLPEFAVQQLPLRGFAIDHQQGPATFQLAIASLKLEDVLLTAYQQSYRTQYLDMAAARFADFFAYHRHSYFSETFLRNDHAVAARVSVVLRLLNIIDNKQLHNAAELRQAALEFLADTAVLLHEDRFYTARTNHGYTQNLALLQLATAFADMPDAKKLRDIAITRIRQQLAYYLSPEGIVLEHSAGYHIFGEKLLGYTEKLMQLNQLDSSDITKLYQAAQQYSRLITRPDLSVPSYGNTELDVKVPYRAASETQPPLAVFPVAGYAVFHQQMPKFGSSLHAVLAWSYFKNNGHKHADEMSLYLWAKGIEWTGGFGYWPYGYAGMEQAYGWSSSNAPHLVAEVKNSQRETRLDGFATQDNFSYVALTRKTAAATLNRQLIVLDNQLLVLDFADSAQAGIATYWNFPAGVSMTATAQALQFKLSAGAEPLQLYISLWGSPMPEVATVHGQMSPAAGWNVLRNQPTSTDALAVHQAKGQSLTVTQLQFSDTEKSTAPVVVTTGGTTDHWQLTTDCYQLSRQQDKLSYQNSCSQHSGSFQLKPQSDLSAYQAIVDASEQAKQRYPYFKALVKYRLYATAAALALLACALLLAFLLRRHVLRRWLLLVNLLGWPAFSCWVLMFYLVV